MYKPIEASVEYQNLPPKIKDFISEIRNYSWFSSSEDVDLKLVENLVNEHQQRLRAFGQKHIYAVKFIRDWKAAHLVARDVVSAVAGNANWNATRLKVIKNARVRIDDVAFHESLKMTERVVQVAATMAVDTAIQNYLQEITLELVQEDLQGIMVDAAWAVAYDVARAAVWCGVEENMREKGYLNPFSPLMEIYKLGLWPMGLVLQKNLFAEKRYFAVFISDRNLK